MNFFDEVSAKLVSICRELFVNRDIESYLCQIISLDLWLCLNIVKYADNDRTT